MVGGFSQGGITAAAFADEYQNRYNIQQVVAVGAPISRFTGIPSTTQVLAIQSSNDPVPRVDGAENPDLPNWETWNFDGGKHNALDYAAKTENRQQVETIQEFMFEDDETVEVRDYYGMRQR